MGVFLRWGVFGIIAVAALVYAYNALGRLAERSRPPVAPVVASEAREASMPPEPGNATTTRSPAAVSAPPDESDAIPAHCQLELDIARRAAEARSIGEPLDRVLRIQEIAWQTDETLRARYTELATHWYDEPGPVDAARLRREVVARCVDATL